MRIGIDIGGTFTDVVAVVDGKTFIAKLPSSYPDPSTVIGAALRKILAKAVASGDQVTGILHGTTVATNAVIERALGVVGLITTAGFRDVLAIGRQTRETLYQLDFTPRWVPVERNLRLEVAERTDFTGRILRAPDRSDVLGAAAELVDGGATAICVGFLHSYANDANERTAAGWIQERYPEIPVWTSARSIRQFREYERFATAVMDAALGATVAGYAARFTEQVRAVGIQPEPYLMESSGGVVRLSEAADHPTHSLLSGPVGGVLGAIHLGQQHGRSSLLTFDMGGTSADIGVIRSGAPEVVGVRYFQDLPVLGTTIALEAIGAGGGSIAWIDRGGRLAVGPGSAGSTPGPACYGRGGTEPTVTDAHVVLGTLPASARLAGALAVDRDLAVAAIDRYVAVPLGIDVISAAHAILAMVNTTMALAARRGTVARGIDPRGFTLVAFGGAGPLHATALADELGLREVYIPPNPGMLSALGLLVSDLRREFICSVTAPLTAEGIDRAAAAAEDVLTEARSWGERQQVASELVIVLEAELRYRGQEHALRMRVPALPWAAATASTIRADFDQLHEDLNGYRVTGEDIEFIAVHAMGSLDVGGSSVRLQFAEGSVAAVESSVTPVWWTNAAAVETSVLSAPDIHGDGWIDGPAILLQEDTTIAVPPGHRFRMLVSTGGVAIERT